ncbi:MAG TPA: dihydrolipoamide acetyltransferase family protein [Candidatus Paceibacterota bacterium]|nr:dihydrolipoamide acetyltransferase family protein [Verrucomicrobiota bacterium]HRY49521.1 dihydrolipoamide acetyltransferase family protein [Candidatus Paceibacterota bacterium]
MQMPILMPQLGESIAEATIIRILVKPGDGVQAGQELLEVETNKAVTHVMASYPGYVKQLLVEVQHSYPVGAILGYLEVSDADASRLGLSTKPSSEPGEPHPSPSNLLEDASSPHPAGVSKVEPTVRGLPVPASAVGVSYMSPRMKARINELGLHAADLAGVAGSGAGGRLTIADFEQFLENLEKRKTHPASSMRIAVADAMRRSWTRPLATVSLPVILDALLAHRKTCEPKPGPTLYALRALAIALSENSAPAGRLVGNRIVHPDSIDIAFAVEAEDGVLVPVIRQADQKTLPQMAERYNELVELARKRQLPVDATGGSIATVTNFGTFGLTWATPIPLPEQTLVLGMGAGRTAPLWDSTSNQFIPVTEANLTLSFDHRVLDGGAAGRLLTRIARLMENPQQL